MRNRWVDGFIIGTTMPDSDHLTQLREEGIPLILIARHNNDPNMDTVAVNNHAAACSAIEYLIKTGNRNIAICTGNTKINLFEERYRGYRDAMEQNGLPIDPRYVIEGELDDDSLYFRIRGMIRNYGRPDAIFAVSDPKAIVVIRAVRDCGLDIPNDVSVMGFDNIKLSSIISPPLSTVSQPLYKMGEVAMRKLCNQISAREAGIQYTPSIDILDAELIIRQSTR